MKRAVGLDEKESSEKTKLPKGKTSQLSRSDNQEKTILVDDEESYEP